MRNLTMLPSSVIIGYKAERQSGNFGDQIQQRTCKQVTQEPVCNVIWGRQIIFSRRARAQIILAPLEIN